jgi:integrase
MKTFTSVLATTIREYLNLKRALGRQYNREEWILTRLDRFLAARKSDLSAETFAAWCLSLQNLASGVRRAHMRDVRNLCLYRRRREPGCFVPDQKVRPHIFTEAQVMRLLAIAHTLTRTSNSPLCPENTRLAIVLLYTTGLRRGELVRLTVEDYRRHERLLVIRASKFHKSRLVPLSADAAREIDHILEIRRRRRFPIEGDSPLLWHRSRSYSHGGLGQVMRALFRKAAIQTLTGRLPRTHDFRHGFALTVLVRWYHAGVDVQTKLPSLATYMGHVSIVSTAYYLQFVEPLAAAASARFAKHCGALITPDPASGGAR